MEIEVSLIVHTISAENKKGGKVTHEDSSFQEHMYMYICMP